MRILKVCMCILLLSLFIYVHPTDVAANPQIDEENLEDSLLTLLLPKIEDEVEKHFGESRLIDCWKVNKIKRLISPNSYFFEITVQIVTLGEQRKPPYHQMTLTFTNFPTDWKVIDKKVKEINQEQLNQFCKE